MLVERNSGLLKPNFNLFLLLLKSHLFLAFHLALRSNLIQKGFRRHVTRCLDFGEIHVFQIRVSRFHRHIRPIRIPIIISICIDSGFDSFDLTGETRSGQQARNILSIGSINVVQYNSNQFLVMAIHVILAVCFLAHSKEVMLFVG